MHSVRGLRVALSCLAAAGVGVSSAFAGAPTAKEALRSLGNKVGAAYTNTVVQVIGIRGVDQPPVWRILARDPYRKGVVRDFTVQNGQVVNDQFVPPAYLGRVPEVPIARAALSTDSNRAFIIADRAASTAKVGFDSLDYEARASDPATGPIWIVRLNDQRGLVVGEVLIQGNSGTVLRQQWFPGGVPNDSSFLVGGGRQGGRQEVEGTGIGETVAEGWSVTKTGVVKAGGAVREFFDDVFKKDENPDVPYRAPASQGQPGVQPKNRPGAYY